MTYAARTPASVSSIPPASGVSPIDVTSYPAKIQEFLRRNQVESSQFIREAPLRAAWLSKHALRPSADLCIDGRVSDFPFALGLYTSLLEMHRSGGNLHNTIASWTYARRNLDGNRKLNNVSVNGSNMKHMAEMRFVTAHHSSGHPRDASCAAWKHNTEGALQAAKNHASELNRCFAGNMVAIPVLIDTDFDSIIVFGPNGKTDTSPLAMNVVGIPADELSDMLTDQLRRIFPASWEPLTLLLCQHHERFIPELTERLVANVSFVRNVIRSKRPVELLTHQERLIFIGRPSEASDHNAAFLIADLEPEAIIKDFAIALPYVTLNVITDAVENDDRDWCVPVVISVPHDLDDLVLTREYAKEIESRLRGVAIVIATSVIGNVTAHFRKRHADAMPEWTVKSLAKLPERIAWCATVNNRTTRLFVPCDQIAV